SFQVNKTEVRFNEVMKFGMDVRGTYTPDGSVSQVTGRGIISQLNVAQMQPFLGASDQEWMVLKPRIEKIQALRRIAESRAGSGGNNNGNSGNGNNPPTPRNPVQELQKSLDGAFFDSTVSTQQLQNRLAALRDTQARARQDLAAARSELIDLLTARQEVMLVI